MQSVYDMNRKRDEKERPGRGGSDGGDDLNDGAEKKVYLSGTHLKLSEKRWIEWLTDTVCSGVIHIGE